MTSVRWWAAGSRPVRPSRPEAVGGPQKATHAHWLGACCLFGAVGFSAGRCGGESCRVGMACCLLPGVCGCEPCRADVACWGGWGPHTPCARQIGPHPPQPTPPSRHGSQRCVWVRRQHMRVAIRYTAASFCQLFPFFVSPRIPVQAHTGSHGQGVSRSDNLCSQCAEDGSPLVRAQSGETSSLVVRAQREAAPLHAERSSPSPSGAQPSLSRMGQTSAACAGAPLLPISLQIVIFSHETAFL